jgi:RNA-directed DNA polymerase
MVNGPEDVMPEWDAVDWRSHEDNVRRLRQRIFKAEQQQDLAAVKNLQTLRRLRGLLELLAVKAARAVLRGDRRSNPPVLPDRSGRCR